MKLRNKILIVISLAWVVFLSLTYLGSKYFLTKSFLELEQDRAHRDLARIDQSLDQINHALYTFTSDWSHWNDLYDYVQGKNPQFVPNNLNMSAYVNSNINLMTFWDNDSKVVVGSAINTDSQKIAAYPAGLEKYIYPGSIVFDRKDVNKDLSGYALTDDGILLIAACAITDGDKVQPPLGTAIFGRKLSQDLVNQIIDTTKVNLQLLLLNSIENDTYLKEIMS